MTARGIVFCSTGLVMLLLLLLWGWKGPISGVGGVPIPGRLVIEVPQFLQGDSRWAKERLAETSGTLGGEGCAVTSAAMVLAHHGINTDPGRLNLFLRDHHGYEEEGWLRWESAAEITPGIIEKAYEDAPSYFLIDRNLLRGEPSIVRIRRPDGITHFVVIVGKQGLEYLIRDPSGAGEGKVYPFRELGVPIEALRYYRRVSR